MTRIGIDIKKCLEIYGVHSWVQIGRSMIFKCRRCGVERL